MAVVIRKATGNDAERIAEFSVALAEQHYGYDQVRFSRLITLEGAAAYYGGRAGSDNASVLVAEIEGRIVGFAYMEYEPVLYAELATKAAWLHDIYIEPDARHSGAGRELIDAVKNEARRLGANKVLLSVSVMNANGREFFEQYGFRTTMHEMMLEVPKERARTVPVRFEGWVRNFKKVSFTKLLRYDFGFTLDQAKLRTDELLDGKIFIIETENFERAKELEIRARELGAVCSVVQNDD